MNYETGVGSINWLEGNVDVDPLFIDPKNGNLQLQNGSPCIDAGIPLFIWKGDTLINVNPTQYIGSAPDMGAYEHGNPSGIEMEITSHSFSLSQNFPNPFNPSTKINWQMPARSQVTLKVYDVLGNEIASLVNEEKEAGYHSIDFNASDFPSGVYFYKLTAGNFISIRKMLLLRIEK